MESEAHQFAGAFLMPLADAKVAMNSLSMLSDFMMMKSGWGISISALVSRARNAGIISYDRYRSLYMQISARGWRKQEPVEVGLEQPLLLKTMLSQKYGDTSGAINSFSVEKDLGIPFRYLDMWSGGLNEQGKEIGFRAKRFEDIDH
jgi:Zn-dependent peptidase ImmA (M78 family)